MKEHKPSRYANRDKRWPALRLAALRRDGWQCVKCGGKSRLQVDHIRSVAVSPGRAFSLDNLQVLCAGCHSRKTYFERTGKRVDPERVRWRRLLSRRS